jgi:beta-lactam-binding protein with PASTA domain
MMTWLLVALLFARPHKMVPVPNVMGLTVTQAEAKLADAGLRCEVREVGPLKAPKGIVVGQPRPGMKVMVNYEVLLYVSKGPKEP